MPPRTSLTASLARLSIKGRGLQTTAPLPPPTSPLPPAATSSTASQPSSSSRAALAHLPPLIPASFASSSSASSSGVAGSPLTATPTNTASAISLIESQSTPSAGRYILARLHARTYLLHPRDILTLPTLKPLRAPGSTLNLTKIIEVGSREYTLRSPAASAALLKRGMDWKAKRLATFDNLPEGLVECQLTVLEHTKSPMERILKKKRRKGYKKTIEHKQGWTRLRVGDIVLGGESSV